MPNQHSPLAVVLYAGEPTLQLTLSTIERQAGVNPQFLVIGNHSKHAAHSRLFDALNAYRDEHDFLIFLGADMSLESPRLFTSLGRLFDEFPRLDHVLLGVDDWYSGEHQLGVNVWRRGVKHGTSPNRLFTDVASNSARVRLKIERPRQTLILHGIDPSVRQAIRYGAQRGMKAAASGKESRWARLRQLVEYTATHPAPQRLLALAGVQAALTDRSLGARCIAGPDQLLPQNIEVLEEVALGSTLLDDLRELVRDEALRARLAAERKDEAFAPSPRRNPSWGSRLRRGQRPVHLHAAEDRFFELLAGHRDEGVTSRDRRLSDDPQPSRSSA